VYRESLERAQDVDGEHGVENARDCLQNLVAAPHAFFEIRQKEEAEDDTKDGFWDQARVKEDCVEESGFELAASLYVGKGEQVDEHEAGEATHFDQLESVNLHEPLPSATDVVLRLSWLVAHWNLFVVTVTLWCVVVSSLRRVPEETIHKTAISMSRRVGLRHRLALPVCCELLLNASLMRGDAVSLFGLVAKLTPGWQVGPWIRIIVERRWLRCSRACAMIMVVCCLGVIYSIRRPIAPILRSTPHLAVVYRSTVLSLSLTIGGRGGSGALICRQMGCRRGRFLDGRVRLSTLHP